MAGSTLLGALVERLAIRPVRDCPAINLVIITIGVSILIRGARIDVRQDAEGYQHGVIVAEAGKRAFFRQKRDGLDEFIEGEGDTIEYDGKADTVNVPRVAPLCTPNVTVSSSTKAKALSLREALTLDPVKFTGAPPEE